MNLRERLAEGLHREADLVGRGDGWPRPDEERALRDRAREPRSLRERIAVGLHGEADRLARGDGPVRLG